jgi:hypothetical protein
MDDQEQRGHGSGQTSPRCSLEAEGPVPAGRCLAAPTRRMQQRASDRAARRPSVESPGKTELPARPVSATRRVRLQGLYASRDVVAGRPALFGRTAESVVTDWPGGIRAGVEVALAPCPGIRVR